MNKLLVKRSKRINTLPKHALRRFWPYFLLNNWKNIVYWRNLLLKKLVFPYLFREKQSMSVLKEKWDNLIILDACRFDFFKKISSEMKLKGRLELRISKGSDTRSFLLKNFSLTKHKDIVYVTANPLVNLVVKNNFYKLISVWKGGWNETYHTVLPQTMYKYAIKARLTYKDKRLIVHFLQPHYPFITAPSIGSDDLERIKELIVKNSKFNSVHKKNHPLKLYDADFRVKFSQYVLIKLYKENLRFVMTYVKRLIDTLPGFTIVTSDHGEAFGEKIHPFIPIRVYGHPFNVRIPSIIKVPWLIVKNKPNKDLKKEIMWAKIQELRFKIKRRFDRKVLY